MRQQKMPISSWFAAWHWPDALHKNSNQDFIKNHQTHSPTDIVVQHQKLTAILPPSYIFPNSTITVSYQTPTICTKPSAANLKYLRCSSSPHLQLAMSQS